MNDEKLEQHLRDLPAPELPLSWRAEILGNAARAACTSSSRRAVWSPALLYFRNLCLRNPFTATALTALWALIFLFKATTPVDPQEKVLFAHLDPNRPVYLVSLSDQILLAQLELDQAEPIPLRQMP